MRRWSKYWDVEAPESTVEPVFWLGRAGKLVDGRVVSPLGITESSTQLQQVAVRIPKDRRPAHPTAVLSWGAPDRSSRARRRGGNLDVITTAPERDLVGVGLSVHPAGVPERAMTTIADRMASLLQR